MEPMMRRHVGSRTSRGTGYDVAFGGWSCIEIQLYFYLAQSLSGSWGSQWGKDKWTREGISARDVSVKLGKWKEGCGIRVNTVEIRIFLRKDLGSLITWVK